MAIDYTLWEIVAVKTEKTFLEIIKLYGPFCMAMLDLLWSTILYKYQSVRIWWNEVGYSGISWYRYRMRYFRGESQQQERFQRICEPRCRPRSCRNCCNKLSLLIHVPRAPSFGFGSKPRKIISTLVFILLYQCV